jgi:outer membrane protein
MKTAMALAAVAALGVCGAAQAQDYQPKAKGSLILNVRATGVSPAGDDPIVTAAGAATGLKAHVGDDIMPTLGLTYFLTDNIAVEAIAGTTQHEVRAQGPGVDLAVHETWVLPPVVSLQYHFAPQAKVSPYVGAGVNYMIFYSGENKNGFDVDIDDGFGLALQAGVDVALKDRWQLNVDVKKVFFETDASVNGGAMKSEVTLDPWVISAGIGYRF